MSEEVVPHIHVTKSEGFVPSERTAAALEKLAEALAADHAIDAEVSGFSMGGDRLTLGSDFKASLTGPEPTGLCFPLFREVETEGGGKTTLCRGFYW